MAKNPTPVRPRRLDERRYQKVIDKRVLLPLFERWAPIIGDVEVLRGSIVSKIDREYNDYIIQDLKDIPSDVARDQIEVLRVYHAKRMTAAFRSALGVNINLSDLQIRPLIQQKIRDNADLITSIPVELKSQLVDAIDDTLTEFGFDQQKLIEVLDKRFDVAGSRAKLISRDQTSKTIGELSKARQTSIGIEEYIWLGAEDERERPTHVILNNTTQRWDTPTHAGIPGEEIQCRCVAGAKVI